MIIDIDIDKKLTCYDFNKPILDFYKGYFEDCFIVLHPFYKQIFRDDYNELKNFKLTYPLIERISWFEILKRTGIKNKEKLALTITYPACDKKYQSLVEHEWEEFQPFLKENNILNAYWEEDKIPEDIILPFLELLLKNGYSEIKVGHWFEFTNHKVEVVKLNDENKFDCAVRFARQNFIYTTDNKYCLKLPYHDFPYSLLLTNKVSANEIAMELYYEGFSADQRTQIYWYLPK
jgi:hypothetical protein